MKIEFTNDSIWQIVGVDNVDSLVGSNPRGIVFSEWSLIDPMVWKLLQPILVENRGWALFNLTPRGKNHGYKTYLVASDNPDWFCSLRTIRETRRDAPGEMGLAVITEEDVNRIRSEGDEDGSLVDEDTIQQEYYCSFQGLVQGAYYSTQMSMAESEGRICRVAWEPRFPVHTAWDLGVGDAMAIGFFQVVGREWRWIDYYESRNIGLLGGIKEVKSKLYVYGRHYAPHDIEAREISTGESRKDFAAQHGIHFEVVPKHSVDDGIDAVRRQFPVFRFDDLKCDGLINAARSYRKIWDDKKQSFQDKPYHDWASHGADMMRCACAGWTPEFTGKRPVVAAGMDFNPLTYNVEPNVRNLPTEAMGDFDPFTGNLRR